jgi:hypothetical protein
MKEIILTPLRYQKKALVDNEDFERLTQHNWGCEKKSNNVRRHNSTSTFISLASAVLQTTMMVDHKDRNGLNNQKYNLRICTYSQNMRNRKKGSNGTSKYKGVSFIKRDQCWLAQHMCNRLGRFKIEEDAARAYDEAARKDFGEFACLNFPREGEQGCLI